jgi:hypothetical protein
MEKKQEKPNKKKIKLKVRDIAPIKDAKGGRCSDPCQGGERRRH